MSSFRLQDIFDGPLKHFKDKMDILFLCLLVRPLPGVSEPHMERRKLDSPWKVKVTIPGLMQLSV